MKRFNLLVTGLLIVLLFINAVTVDAQSLYKYKAVEEIRIPEVIYSANPGYVELYNKAWQLALEHVKYQDGLPQVHMLMKRLTRIRYGFGTRHL